MPSNYIPVLNQRLDMYLRLYMARNTDRLLDLKRELSQNKTIIEYFKN